MPTSNSARQSDLAPYWSALGAELHLGDARERLRAMPTRSAHCVVTSPPYWGLRDYGTAVWQGGDENCNHESARIKGLADYGFSDARAKQATNASAGFSTYSQQCPTCRAVRVDNQLGLEEVPDCLGWATGAPCGSCYVCHMVAVFAEVRRVLRDDGTTWLNVGDSYSSGGRRGTLTLRRRCRLTSPRLRDACVDFCPCFLARPRPMMPHGGILGGAGHDPRNGSEIHDARTAPAQAQNVAAEAVNRGRRVRRQRLLR